MRPPPETLTAPLVLLRRAKPADAQCLYLAARNAEVMRFMDWPMPTAAVVAWLEAQPEIIRIWASVDVENVRSRRLLERLGLRLEGVRRMATLRPNIGGPPRDTAVYARTKSPVRWL